MKEFVGARTPTAVSAWLDELLAPPRADALLEELRSAGELPDVVAALDAEDVERALSLIVDAVQGAEPEEQERLREVAVALFEGVGHEDPSSRRTAAGWRRFSTDAAGTFRVGCIRPLQAR